MSEIELINIILCGGNGTRLWPISRTLLPKQFVKLINEQSLFQLTALRNNFCAQQLIVSNTEQYFIASDQLDEIEVVDKSCFNSKFLLEPVGRNTAPAIALSCFAVDPEEIVLVTPSDHLIKNQETYELAIKRAEELANEDYLVTFGIVPDFPETGFGHIEGRSEDVIAFHEKPNLKQAQSFLEKGGFYWNSGMFCFKAGVFLEELKQLSPDIYSKAKVAFDNAKQGEMIRFALDDMQNIPDDSIDYAVMEKSKRIKVVPSDIGWSDLGCFDALDSVFPKDRFGNTQCNNNINIDSKNNFISGCNRTIATLGVNDLIIVDTPDALLVSAK